MFWYTLPATRLVVEYAGYYIFYVPSIGLQRVAAVLDGAVTARLPASLPVIGGKCAKVRAVALLAL